MKNGCFFFEHQNRYFLVIIKKSLVVKNVDQSLNIQEFSSHYLSLC